MPDDPESFDEDWSEPDWGDVFGQFGTPPAGLADFLRQAGLDLPSEASFEEMLASLADQLPKLGHRFRQSGGQAPDLWVVAEQAARNQIGLPGPDPIPDGRRLREVADAAHLVDMWLDEHLSFARLVVPPTAWSRTQWLELTLPAWKQILSPVLNTLGDSLQSALQERLMPVDELPELASLRSVFEAGLRPAVDSLLGTRMGNELGRIAADVQAATDLGFPLSDQGQVALLPTNVAALFVGLDLTDTDVLLAIALRETARQRLFSAVGWIGPQLLALVQHYARETKIDPDAISVAIQDSIPEQITMEAFNQFNIEISTQLFAARTNEQTAILERLETLLALVEGWVTDVTEQAASRWMPTAAAIDETRRRRRASGGDAAAAFETLLGVSVKPALVRSAKGFWSLLRHERGVAGRDEVWRHPSSLPDTAGLADPQAWLDQSGVDEDEFDAELRRLLDEPPEGEASIQE